MNLQTQNPTAPGGIPLLEVKNLKTYFFLDEGTVKAVDKIDFNINKGEILGVVGESGCGKSVTALSIMRALAPRGKIVEGEILLHRENGNILDLAKLDPQGSEIRRIRGKDIAMIFQEPMTSFIEVYTVGEQIIEAITLHQNVTKKEARKIAIEMLRKVGIPNPEERINAYPFELSGGMRQRAMIAMALSCNPGLLIADEPTTALDVTIQAQILYLMRNLQREIGMAIMLITHNMGVIAKMADNVIVMYLGKVVEGAPVNELFYNPKHPYTVSLLKSIPKVGKKARTRLESIKGMIPDPYNLPQGCKFHPRCPSYMRGVCERTEPPLVKLSPGHEVSCFLYGGGRWIATSYWK
ncbi:MAG: ABC transporter ATP-binding protein [bacterium]